MIASSRVLERNVDSGFGVHSRDTDKHASPFLRLHPAQPKRWYFEYQHIYFPVLACINTLSNQFTHFKYMWNEPRDGGRMRTSQIVRYYIALAIWTCLAYVIPMYHFGFVGALKPIFIFQAVGSGWATYNIVINHIFEQGTTSSFPMQVSEVHYRIVFELTEQRSAAAHTSTESFGKSFAKMQASASCNHGAGSMVSTFFSGALNHQIEHHMFPSLAMHLFPLISPGIERICNKHKVRYNKMSMFSLICSMHTTLKMYGTCKSTAHLPGLGDYQELMDGE